MLPCGTATWNGAARPSSLWQKFLKPRPPSEPLSLSSRLIASAVSRVMHSARFPKSRGGSAYASLGMTGGAVPTASVLPFMHAMSGTLMDPHAFRRSIRASNTLRARDNTPWGAQPGDLPFGHDSLPATPSLVQPSAPPPSPPAEMPPDAVASGPHNPRQVFVDHAHDGGSVSPGPLAARLRAAKPVTWRGRGDLPQVPWAAPFRGTWLVLDLWSGTAGLCMALLQLGVHFYAIAAESDPIAAQVACHNMPNLVHVSSVEELCAADLVPFLQRRQVRGVLLGGGSPCQGNSALNTHRKGLADRRSCQPLELQRLQQELHALPEMHNVELVAFLENVASMPPQVRSQYTQWLRGEPVLVDSASCGWVQRRRLYRLVSRHKSLHAQLQPPACWDWVPGDGVVPQLQYVGDKPLPNRCFFAQGFQPLGIFYTGDRTSSSSSAAVERFFADARRFPPSAYEERSLVWKGEEWRQPLPSERAQLLGVPPDCLDAVPGDAALKRQRQNCLLGNGFHLYSVLAILCMLPQLLEAKLAAPLVWHSEVSLRSRLLHTVWEPGRLTDFPGLHSAESIASRLPHLFPECRVDAAVWSDVRRRLSHCSLLDLQAYMGWCRLRGLATDDLGPQPLQRAPSPCAADCRYCSPACLEEALAAWRVESAHHVASSKRPGFVATLTVLLQWPDLFQAQCLVRGYPIVGTIAPTGLFRPILPREIDSLDDWVADAEAIIDALVKSRPPRAVDDILAQTIAEQEKGFCSQFYSRSAIDARFGPGQWRPLERFAITQADQKIRMIDNARRTEHNAHTSMPETIFTVSIDMIASVAAALGSALQLSPDVDTQAKFPWLSLRLGTDDLPDAYRGLPVHPDHQRFSIVAVYVPEQGWRFTILWGLAFGLESAVVSFNRFPQLGIAIARRCTLSLAAAYFDDELAIEAVRDADCSQAGLRLVFKLMGAPPQAGKGYMPSANRHYLGTSIHTGDFTLLGIVIAQWKPRAQQIFPGETIAALVIPHLCADVLRDSDVVWFIDNEASAAALVRVTSGEEDILLMVQHAHLQFHALRIRPRFEWIDSESNPADGLSRLGLLDEWTLSQPWHAEDAQRLQQENSSLRQQLELCEHARRVSEQKEQGKQECWGGLSRDMGFLRQEVVAQRRHPAWQVPITPPSLSGWDGHVGSAAAPTSTAPAVLIPAPCLHGNSQPGSAPVTPRVPQLRQLPSRMHVAPMSAAAPSGLSMARMAQSAFTVPAMVERMREPCNLTGSAEAPQQVGVMPAGRCTPTSKVTKVSTLRISGQR
eukprot:s1670_g2.t1